MCGYMGAQVSLHSYGLHSYGPMNGYMRAQMAYIVMAYSYGLCRYGLCAAPRCPMMGGTRSRTCRLRPDRAPRSTRRRATHFFFKISEHADGDRRGPVADLKVPEDASRRDLSDAALRLIQPSAFAVGMRRNVLKIGAINLDGTATLGQCMAWTP